MGQNDGGGENLWYGYKRIAVMCRRAGQGVTYKQAYRVMKEECLLHRRKPLDVTYVHILNSEPRH